MLESNWRDVLQTGMILVVLQKVLTAIEDGSPSSSRTLVGGIVNREPLKQYHSQIAMDVGRVQ